MAGVSLSVSCRVLEFERKKKKKFHQGASKERLKYYDLILKRLHDILEQESRVASDPNPE